MSYRTNIVYLYDGTYDGFLCCVFESFEKKEIPVAIEPYGEEQFTLFTVREITTDPEKAERVKRSIPAKISLEAKELIEKAFLSNMREKELHILYFMRLGYKYGKKASEMLDHIDVAALKKAALSLEREAHLLTGFVRFSDYGGVLLAQITPKNNVLPLLASHFCDRFSTETFMIYDKTHKIALIHQNGRKEFVRVEHLEPPPSNPEEEQYRALWRKFYDTIGIEGRYNPRCQQTHLPLRYRENMTEFQPAPQPDSTPCFFPPEKTCGQKEQKMIDKMKNLTYNAS